MLESNPDKSALNKPLTWGFFFALLLLPSCAEWTAFKSGVSVHGAQVADEELVTARWMTCEAATVGAVRRKYQSDPEGLKAWQDFCRLKEQKAVMP